MDEINTQTDNEPVVVVPEPVVKPRFLQRVTTNHPRIARVAAITGAVGTTIGAVAVATCVRKNKHSDDSETNDNENDNVYLGDFSTSASYKDSEV